MLILRHRCFIHGHATSRKKKKTYQAITRNSPTTDFRATFLYNRRCLTSGRTKSRDENKVAATPTEQGNFYWERILCLFWILYKESITMLLVILVHQFIWATFTLVFTRNGIFFIVSACPAAGSDKPKTSMPDSCNAHARNLSISK